MAATDSKPSSLRDLVLAGGGQMGERMRAHDWAATAVGDVEHWPQSLRTVVSMALASGYPMLVVWGPEFVQFYNDAYAPVLGTKHPAALGQSTPECWSEIWENMLGPMFHQVIDTGVEISAKDLMFPLARHGFIEECYFDFSYSPIRDESYAASGILATLSETTGRVLSERRLKVLRDMAEASSPAHSAVEACRASADVLRANAADVPFALTYLVAEDGVTASLAASAGLDEHAPAAVPSIDLSIVSDQSPWPIAEARARDGPVLIDDLSRRFGHLPGGPWPEAPDHALVLPFGHRAGQESAAGFLVAGVSPRLRLDDEYRSFLGLVADQIGSAIANARALEQERRRAEALAELDRAKTAFFSNVSHEFRTPLALLLGPLEDVLGRDVELAADVRDQLELARRNGLRLLRLVNMLLDFSRIEAGRMQAVYEATDLATCTRDLASSFRSAVERAGLKFVVDCRPLPEPVFVDRDLWEKIVLNLLSNALKFTFEGEIAVALRTHDNVADLVVRDTGIGIAQDDLTDIFERFHRVVGARARTHEGSGIGLSLVQELVRLHGGDIEVRSTLGEGTEFKVSIPLGTAHLPADRINAARAAQSTFDPSDVYVDEALRWLTPVPAPSALPPVAASSRARVLIVDDNADMREYLSRLIHEHHDVELAADGQTALDLALSNPPDLVVTDVMMPGLDGFQLLNALRSHDQTRLVPVIVLSARAGEEATVEGLSAGADDYLVKPFTARELVARVDTNLELARLRREALRLEQIAREQSEHERARLRQLFEQAPAIMCTLSGPEHIFTFANARYVQTIGNRPVIGKSMREVLPELEDQGFFDMLDSVFVTGEPHVEREARVLLGRGLRGAFEETYFDYISAPIRDAVGNVEGVLVHGFEVTEFVRARQRFEALATENARLYVESQRATAQLEQQRKAFISAAAHDLRTPVATVRMLAQLARRRIDSAGAGGIPDAQRHLSSIDASTLRMSALIDELLDMSKLEAAGQLVLDRSETDLVTLVENVVSEQQTSTTAHALRLVAADHHLVGYWDAGRLERVFGNLLGNAVKFSPTGGEVVVGIGREHYAGATWASVSVQDSGVGIPEQDLERIFRRFERGTNIGHIPGTGVGLAYVQDIVTQHGGSVTVESTPGLGSTFRVRLPLE